MSRKRSQETVKEKAEKKGFLSQALQLFSDHLRQLAQDFEDFNQNQRKVEERIDRGPRRTDGKIV